MLKFAQFVSVVGHPLLTIPVFTAIALFKNGNIGNAIFVSFLIIGCIFIPLLLWMYIKSRNGSYTNFDVSDRKQRKSLFLFAIPLLLIVTVVLYKTNQSENLRITVLFALILTVVSQIVNFFIKSSLHVSLTIFLASLLYTFDYRIGIIVLLFTGLLAWSRVKLKRHTVKEVICGFLTGTCVGLLMLGFEGYF